MNEYAPPGAPVGTLGARPLSLAARVFAFPAFAIGAVISGVAAYWLIGFLPVPRGNRALSLSALVSFSCLFALLAAAPWWLAIARAYGRHSFLVGAFLGLAPVGLRLYLGSGAPMSGFMTVITLIETAGVVIAFALGSHLAATRLGANNSSKPTPLRGAA